MIAEVAFDVPRPHPFSYRVPEGWTLVPGQRVLAPLRGAQRVGIVVAVRVADEAGLKTPTRLVDPAPVLGEAGLELARWIAGESLSSLGSTLAALLPPPPAAVVDPVPPRPCAGDVTLSTGAGRERRLMERLTAAPGRTLVVVPDVESAARWAQRLGKLGAVARLDSGLADAERAEAWRRLTAGDVRLGVGTRSALLAPLGENATVALVDEHEAAHKPPGPPRVHSRDVILRRAATEGTAALLTSATPSCEAWRLAADGRATLDAGGPGTWPAVQLADTRGILRREPLTPALARALREAIGAGRRALVLVSRLASAVACDECGVVLRCPDCALALAYWRARAALECRVCGRTVPLPETCPQCRGRRLTPFGWGIERVEHAVRRRFPDVTIARFDPETARGTRGHAQRAATAEAAVVVGTRGALKLFGPGSFGTVGLVSPDQLLRVPDFRAGERTFALLWSAAERVAAGGTLVVQTSDPTHYAFDAVARQDLAAFYARELPFRRELGYPPFRRLAVVTLTGSGSASLRLVDDVTAALRGTPGTTIYPPVTDARHRRCRAVVKGGGNLAAILREALGELMAPRPKSRGIIEVEVDPVEWQF